MGKPNCFRSYSEIRKETYLFLLMFIVLIPTLICTYYYVQPKIERTYIVNFSEIFDYPTFNITYWDKITNDNKEVDFDSSDFGSTVNITKIEFGFQNYDDLYTSSEFLMAYYYQLSGASNYLDYEIIRGQYLLRSFNLDSSVPIESLGFKFKMLPDFQLFMIKIIVTCTITQNFTLIQDFSYFFDSENRENYMEKTINLYGLKFYSNIYESDYQHTPNLNYPYSLFLTTINSLTSRYMFDFSFR